MSSSSLPLPATHNPAEVEEAEEDALEAVADENGENEEKKGKQEKVSSSSESSESTSTDCPTTDDDGKSKPQSRKRKNNLSSKEQRRRMRQRITRRIIEREIENERQAKEAKRLENNRKLLALDVTTTASQLCKKVLWNNPISALIDPSMLPVWIREFLQDSKGFKKFLSKKDASAIHTRNPRFQRLLKTEKRQAEIDGLKKFSTTNALLNDIETSVKRKLMDINGNRAGEFTPLKLVKTTKSGDEFVVRINTVYDPYESDLDENDDPDGERTAKSVRSKFYLHWNGLSQQQKQKDRTLVWKSNAYQMRGHNNVRYFLPEAELASEILNICFCLVTVCWRPTNQQLPIDVCKEIWSFLVEPEVVYHTYYVCKDCSFQTKRPEAMKQHLREIPPSRPPCMSYHPSWVPNMEHESVNEAQIVETTKVQAVNPKPTFDQKYRSFPDKEKPYYHQIPNGGTGNCFSLVQFRGNQQKQKQEGREEVSLKELLKGVNSEVYRKVQCIVAGKTSDVADGSDISDGQDG